MASSRLEKLGTIYSRITGLLKSGAMKIEDKPLWYDIYRAFPPKLEPYYGRTVDIAPILPIFYPEDKLRAIFHKKIKKLPADNLINEDIPEITKRAIEMAQSLIKNEGGTEEEAINSVIKTLKSEGFFKKKAVSVSSPVDTTTDTKIMDTYSIPTVTTDTDTIKDISDQNVNVADYIDPNDVSNEK